MSSDPSSRLCSSSSHRSLVKRTQCGTARHDAAHTCQRDRPEPGIEHYTQMRMVREYDQLTKKKQSDTNICRSLSYLFTSPFALLRLLFLLLQWCLHLDPVEIPNENSCSKSVVPRQLSRNLRERPYLFSVLHLVLRLILHTVSSSKAIRQESIFPLCFLFSAGPVLHLSWRRFFPLPPTSLPPLLSSCSFCSCANFACFSFFTLFCLVSRSSCVSLLSEAYSSSYLRFYLPSGTLTHGNHGSIPRGLSNVRQAINQSPQEADQVLILCFRCRIAMGKRTLH